MPSPIATRWEGQNSSPIFRHLWAKVHQINLSSLQCRFPTDDDLLHSGDIRNQAKANYCVMCCLNIIHIQYMIERLRWHWCRAGSYLCQGHREGTAGRSAIELFVDDTVCCLTDVSRHAVVHPSSACPSECNPTRDGKNPTKTTIITK